MNCVQSFMSISMLCLFCGSSALADRAWEGHIHLVDANIKMVFDGYDYGSWDDVGRLDFPAQGRPSGGSWSVAFRITPDDDKPLRATIHGKVELVVDEQRAVINELRFVRKHKHADWQIDPKIIRDLKKPAERNQKGQDHSEHEGNGKPATEQHNTPANSNASSDSTPATLLDIDFRNLSTLDALGNGWEFKQTSLSRKGLFLNGRYEFGDDGYRAVVPIDDLDYSQFSFSVDFLPLDFDPERTGSSALISHFAGVPSGDPHTNLLVGGTSYRWFGIKVRDGHLWLTLNNGELEYPYQHAAVSEREWHTVSGSIDLGDGVVHLMLDGEFVATEKLPQGVVFTVVSSPEEKNDRQLTFTDYSNGETFHGYVARVTVLDAALNEQKLADWYKSGCEYRKGLRKLSPSGTIRDSISAAMIVFVAGCIICVVAAWKCRNRIRLGFQDSAALP